MDPARDPDLQNHQDEVDVSKNSSSAHETEPLLNRPQAKRGLSLSRVLRGLGSAVCIALIVASWISMAQLLQGMGKHYDKPFFQAYLIHSSYSLLYVAWKLWLVFPGNFACNKVGEGTLTNFRSLAISSGVLAFIAFLSGALWYLSLPRTSISANTAVYQSASALVFVLSIPVLRERVSVLKVISVCMTVTGVTLVSVYGLKKGHDKVKSTPLGYVYLAISTLLYAVSEVGFKKFYSRADDPAPVQNGIRGVGYFGVHTLLWMWPTLIILHYTGAEPFELPDMWTFKILLLNSLLDIIFFVALFVCIALSSPLVATVGSVLVIPASVIVDWLIDHHVLPPEAIVGIIIILAGFFALVFSEVFEIFYYRRQGQHESSTVISAEHTINTAPKWKQWSHKRLLHYII